MAASIILPPFPSKYQLRSQLDVLDYVVEVPAVRPQDEDLLSLAAVGDFLSRELDTPILNDLYPHLWLVAKKSGDHIDALHQHCIQNRKITIAEDPALHLIWYYGILYLKPIPQCLFIHAFWKDYLLPSKPECLGDQQAYATASNSHLCRTALGYLRSYSFLVQHESDYLIAQRADLIPKDITYQEFRRFILPFRSIPDEAVSPRYHFGQLRLSRLKYAVRLLRPFSLGSTMVYHHSCYWQTGQCLRRFGTPLLFLFAAFSVVLSAMQVTLAALPQDTWPAFVRASWGFSVTAFILIAGFAVSAMLGVLAILVSQGQYALRMRHREKATAARPVSA